MRASTHTLERVVRTKVFGFRPLVLHRIVERIFVYRFRKIRKIASGADSRPTLKVFHRKNITPFRLGGSPSSCLFRSVIIRRNYKQLRAVMRIPQKRERKRRRSRRLTAFRMRRNGVGERYQIDRGWSVTRVGRSKGS